MATEKLPREQQLEELRHERVSDLLALLSRPTYVYRSTTGILQTDHRSMKWASQVKIDAMTRSATTRRRNAEREIEETIKAWYQEHFEND